MIEPRTTALYAALLGILFLAISLRVIAARRDAKIAVGTGEDRRLLRASRAHGNFAEYVPLILLLIALAETTGTPRPVIHAIGLATLIGRAVHAYGIRREPERFVFRVTGMALTFTALSVAVLAALWGALF
ncbi:MAPEG family protein [Plastoroseomonas arctica]|uniref:Glutathione metabolism protein n=1 Tax=Plastoroseomonas arctica TaxID=1509237 RepID=A0AAF1KSR4_9PROT|nr:MAPEG family protein [Plastoroseomonas arctica]MBR0654942.1 glutathione metabolism protein [Plastoroseomonas arctica]